MLSRSFKLIILASNYDVPSGKKFSKTFGEGFLKKWESLLKNPLLRKNFVYHPMTFKFYSLIAICLGYIPTKFQRNRFNHHRDIKGQT
jgi:hypothetical protein